MRTRWAILGALVALLASASVAAASRPVVTMRESADAVASWESWAFSPDDVQVDGEGMGVECRPSPASVATRRYCDAAVAVGYGSDPAAGFTASHRFSWCGVYRTSRTARHTRPAGDHVRVRVRNRVELRCRIASGPVVGHVPPAAVERRVAVGPDAMTHAIGPAYARMVERVYGATSYTVTCPASTRRPIRCYVGWGGAGGRGEIVRIRCAIVPPRPARSIAYEDYSARAIIPGVRRAGASCSEDRTRGLRRAAVQRAATDWLRWSYAVTGSAATLSGVVSRCTVERGRWRCWTTYRVADPELGEWVEQVEHTGCVRDASIERHGVRDYSRNRVGARVSIGWRVGGVQCARTVTTQPGATDA